MSEIFPIVGYYSKITFACISILMVLLGLILSSLKRRIVRYNFRLNKLKERNDILNSRCKEISDTYRDLQENNICDECDKSLENCSLTPLLKQLEELDVERKQLDKDLKNLNREISFVNKLVHSPFGETLRFIGNIETVPKEVRSQK